ncbi:hypothetical protein GGP99_000218 [Salinibacter ruber]|uniref:Uncharacterized protein n=1 Tax=Salinibacter ruber TaxID=146919 RepID=A0AAW5P2V0_9BACT|nr:hypothetical protein [Salinibacter ruber]MCS4222419.1 hypothetical protein [Salinibacter ruber]
MPQYVSIYFQHHNGTIQTTNVLTHFAGGVELSTPQRYDSDTAILLICRPGPCHFKHHKGTIQTFTGGVVA